MKYRVVPCPKCGGPMDDRSKQCAICASAHPESEPSLYDVCPICNGPKTKKAKQCRACHLGARSRNPDELFNSTRPWWGGRKDFSTVPEDFCRSFAGFFLGEGYVGISRPPNCTVRCAIGLRLDDEPVLRQAHEHFGGSLRPAHRRNQVDWVISGQGHCLSFLEIIEKYGSVLHARKLDDIRLALEYIYWRISRPHHHSREDKQIQWDYYKRMKAIKRL